MGPAHERSRFSGRVQRQLFLCGFCQQESIHGMLRAGRHRWMREWLEGPPFSVFVADFRFIARGRFAGDEWCLIGRAVVYPGGYFGDHLIGELRLLVRHVRLLPVADHLHQLAAGGVERHHAHTLRPAS